ncbi:hypothetical protein Poli38472_004525 [Pythium oligandrum]|uniref:Calmodulin n=1 Tax=Pythium oligandrum TaxID=41045 RepID=A0A8K1CAL8_PYTOL|nr:hypothetical protein Poli38472_004525 [Pythium oligandrum]|eukprot:TMW59456.1 hypothetical protein Poli38472_004525 [Pythium oligandrum]
MSSPQKPSGSTSKPRGSEFPLLRARSPKKKNESTAKKTTRTNGQHIELPRVGSITYANSTIGTSTKTLAPVPDSGEELEILKCILVREGYLQRLTTASSAGKVSGSHLSATIDVLDLLRIATIEVVEAIVAWRVKKQRQLKATTNAPVDPATLVFQWNSLNYLLKIGSDLDFLEKHLGLVQWLGFTLTRNPFILPVNLDGRAKLDAAEHLASESPTHIIKSRANYDESQFVQVGGKRVIDRRPDTVEQHRAQMAGAALAERKRAKNPYETRVVNDEELVPMGSVKSGLGETTRPRSRGGASNGSSSSLVMPSQIGDLDMSRIRSCELVILQEERLHGRYTHDIQGHIVPEAEAQRRFNMVEMSDDAYSYQNTSAHGTVDDRASGEDERSAPQVESREAKLAPKAFAKKRAGMLGPISKPQHLKPTRKPPTERARGAHLEEALTIEKQTNLEFGVAIDGLREEIERKEMDLAYFESFSGVQFYGSELQDFQQKTHREVSQLRKDLTEKQYVYESRAASILRKEEIIHIFKENRKAAVEAEREQVIANQSKPIRGAHSSSLANQEEPKEGSTPSQPSENAALAISRATLQDFYGSAATSPLVHHMCATLIQKIARGKLARAAFESMKIEYYVGSKYIQAVVRGFLARRRVARLYWQLTASLVLQRFARGMLARLRVARKRLALRRERSALRIQRVLRGHFGRCRMLKIRKLFAARVELTQASSELGASDFKELAAACLSMVAIPSLSVSVKGHSHLQQPLTSLVLGLVRVLMVFTTDQDVDIDVCNVRWREAAHFLQCSVRLQRRMSKIAVASVGRYLRQSLLGSALLEMYNKDEAFSETTFSRLERGWRAATAIFRWITAFDSVSKLQSVLPPFDYVDGDDTGPFAFAQALTATERKQERVEDQENTVQDEAIVRRFVPKELTHVAKYPLHRPRPVLLVVAFDLPTQAKHRIMDKLMSLLPGLLVVLNRRSDVPAVDKSTQRRIPMAKQEQLETLGTDFTSVHEALAVGLSVVLECDVGLTDSQQRRFTGAFSALKAAIKPSPLCILLRGSLRNRREDIVAQVERPPGELNRNETEDSAADPTRGEGKLKALFEESAEWLARLAEPTVATQMARLSTEDSPPSPALVLAMEAIVILLTPTKRYDGPKRHVNGGGVSWKLSRRLLAKPRFLHQKLRDVAYDSITSDNLRALQQYLRHVEWPSAVLAHSVSYGGETVHSLASWVESVVKCAQTAEDLHGLAPMITRTTPVRGLFTNAIVYRNDFVDSYIQGEDSVLRELLDAILADVRVFRKCHILDGRRCVLNVYHDCQRIYFTAYDPETSWRWQSVIPEGDANTLLAPNSIERSDVSKTPPTTREEMYSRLVDLCLLQSINAPRKTSLDTTALRSDEKELIVRPTAVRLYRRAIRLNGRQATVTMAELSRGRIQVDVFVHGSAMEIRRIVSLEAILERLSNLASREHFILPERLPAIVLERLHLFSRYKSQAYHHVDDSSEAKLVVRSKETAPGRLLLRKAIQSPWLPSRRGASSTRWMLSVYEHVSTGRFRLEVYQPISCERFSFFITRREFQDLSLTDLCKRASGPRPSVLQKLLTRLHFVLDAEADDVEEIPQIHTCHVRHIHLRFPLVLPFIPTPHQVVELRQVLRCYVQVETRMRSTEGQASHVEPMGELVYRISMPETCEEQTIVLSDAEVDAYFAHSEALWRAAPLSTRKSMAYDLARHALHWDSSTKRVVAHLPSEMFEASPSTRQTGRTKQKPPPSRGVVSRKKSPFSLRGLQSSRSVPIPSTCVRLLDGDVSEEGIVFVYDREESIHKGSYRANGVLVMVEVFMKAIVVKTLEPRVPVDRVVESDSFEVRFDFYHPGSSQKRSMVVLGRRELREVVGPERAELIASSSVHELIEYIVEARTVITFEAKGPEPKEQATKTPKHSPEMQVAFIRDRLYAKQKATPINDVSAADQAKNATKLIDQRAGRGLKILSKSRVLDGVGRTIITVFDVSHTRSQSTKLPDGMVQLRVDAYVCTTSTRLSLSLEAVDLVQVVGEAKHLLSTSSFSPSDIERKQLAERVVEHIAIECKRDGSADRLFLLETTPPRTQSPAADLANGSATELLGKTVRHIGYIQVLISVFLDLGDTSLRIRLYDPQISARDELWVPKLALALMFGLEEDILTSQVILDFAQTSGGAKIVVAHVLSFVCFEPIPENDNIETAPLMRVRASLQVDEHTAATLRSELNAHRGLGFETTTISQESTTEISRWKGLMMVTTTTQGRECCAVHVEVQQTATPSWRGIYSVYLPRKMVVLTSAIPPRVLESIVVGLNFNSTPITQTIMQECRQKMVISRQIDGFESDDSLTQQFQIQFQ